MPSHITAVIQFSTFFLVSLGLLTTYHCRKWDIKAQKTEDSMTTAVVGLPQKLPMMVGSTVKLENVTGKSKMKSDLVEPEKNWAELNPDFDVPHRGYE